jgi:hypothetical protein
MMMIMISQKIKIILHPIPEINKTLSDDKTRYFEADLQRFGHNFGFHHQERMEEKLCGLSPEYAKKL